MGLFASRMKDELGAGVSQGAGVFQGGVSPKVGCLPRCAPHGPYTLSMPQSHEDYEENENVMQVRRHPPSGAGAGRAASPGFLQPFIVHHQGL